MTGPDAPTAPVTAALVGVLLLTATAAPAVAATDTPVRLVGVDGPTAVGETATVPVVVSEAEGGVGAYNLTVAVEDPDVATVVDIELAGDPGVREVEIAPDGSHVTVRAALMDTADAGEVTVATVTVAGEAAGKTDLTVAVETLGDEAGSPYAVTAEKGTSLTVEDDTGSTDRSNDDVTGTSGDDSGSDDGTDASDDESDGPGDGNSASGDGNEASTDGNGTEGGSTADEESTGTTTSTGQSAGTASESDAGDEEWTGLPEVSGFGPYLSPSAAAFALFAAMALIGGVAYQRRLR